MKDGKIYCTEYNGTGKIKYKAIEWSMYSWQPWLERNCKCRVK